MHVVREDDVFHRHVWILVTEFKTYIIEIASMCALLMTSVCPEKLPEGFLRNHFRGNEALCS